MNKLQRIEEMERQHLALGAEIAALRAEVEQESKVEKWEPKGGAFYTNYSGEVHNMGSTDNCRLFGAERQTREAAERARDKMRVFNRLLAYVDEFAPGYEFIYGEENYFIYLLEDGIYDYGAEDDYPDLCTVYMPQNVAEELCRKLNSGEVVL